MQNLTKYSILDTTDFRFISEQLKEKYSQKYSVDYIRQLLRGYTGRTNKCELVFTLADHQLKSKIDKIINNGN